jgi:hypothetical protein
MSARNPQGVFLERRAYHKRRMRDLARAVPVFGAVLISIPLLWQQGESGVSNSTAIVYIFGVWIILIGLAAIISRAVQSGEQSEAPSEDL